MRDKQTTNDEQLKIELLSRWKQEAESRNIKKILVCSNIMTETHMTSITHIYAGRGQSHWESQG